MATKRPQPSLLDLEQTAREYARALSAVVGVTPTTSGQTSMDLLYGTLLPAGVLLRPPEDDTLWQATALDDRTLDKMDERALLMLLVNLDPLVSAGLYYFLRLCNPGYTWSMELLAGGGTAPDAAWAALNDFLGRLVARHGALDVLFNVLFFAAWARGAFLSELVFAEDHRTPIDLATPDPGTTAFRTVPDEQKPGQVRWQLVQMQGGAVVPLERPTITYIPVDRAPGSPYGRGLAWPALWPAIFLLGLLHNLRKVMSQQGMPRIDIEVDDAVVRAGMPRGTDADPVAWRTWVTAVMDSIAIAYRQVPVDGAYLHVKGITVNKQAVGTSDPNSIGGLPALIDFLERELARALKTMPILLGIRDAASESDANRQWEIQAAGIKSLQHLNENMLGRQFSLALQAQGFPVKVTCRFSELRSAEEQRDALTLARKIANHAMLVLLGAETWAEAITALTGSPPAEGTVPPAENVLMALAGLKVAQPAPSLVAEPGANRDAPLTLLQRWTPKGSPGAAAPDTITYDPAAVDAVVEAFKGAVPEAYRALIEAEVEGAA